MLGPRFADSVEMHYAIRDINKQFRTSELLGKVPEDKAKNLLDFCRRLSNFRADILPNYEVTFAPWVIIGGFFLTGIFWQ